MNDSAQQADLSNDPQPWATHATTTPFQNRWITVALDQVELPTTVQYEYTRVIVNGPGAANDPSAANDVRGGQAAGVAVVGFNLAGELLLEREYRHGIGQVIWQLPGGLANANEDLPTAGLRELLEETGHAPRQVTAESVRYLGMVWDNPGLGAMQSHVVGAWDLVETAHPRRDPAEFVTLHWRSVAWVKAAIRSGEIQDRVVLAALTFLIVHDLIA